MEKMKITSAERLQILMQYQYQPVYFETGRSDKTIPIRADIYYTAMNEEFASDKAKVSFGGWTHFIEEVSVIVRPLEDINENDVAEICGKIGILYHGIDGYQSARKYILSVLDRKVSDALTCQQIQAIIDNLRCRGYAVPYGLYSVEQLVECGILNLQPIGKQ